MNFNYQQFYNVQFYYFQVNEFGMITVMPKKNTALFLIKSSSKLEDKMEDEMGKLDNMYEKEEWELNRLLFKLSRLEMEARYNLFLNNVSK